MINDIKLSEEETAVYLEVSQRTLANWRADNKGPKFYKPAQKIYYFKSDIDEWIRSSE